MNRVEITKWFLDKVNKLQPGNKNVEMYKKHFDSLSDKAFAELMEKLASGKIVLPYISANLKDKDVEVPNALKVAKELGLKVFQRLWLIDPVSGVKYLTPEEYFIIHMPVRRQSQHVMKGKKVVEDSSFIDSLTGQPAGTSKTSRLSLPEIMNLDSLGLRNGIEELISIRGGNVIAFRESKRKILTTGTYTLKEMRELGSRAVSNETLKNLLLGMHISSNV